VLPASCAGSGGYGIDFDSQATGPTLTVARMGTGRYLVTTPGFETGRATVRQVQTPQDDWSCEAALAAPIHMGSEGVVFWVTPDLASRIGHTPVTISKNKWRDGGAGDFFRSNGTLMHVYETPIRDGAVTVGALAVFHDAGYIESRQMAVWRHALTGLAACGTSSR